MRHWLSVVACCVLLLWHSPANADASETKSKPRIHWVQLDFPPYYLKTSNDGRDESVATLLESYLPQFEFRRLQVPASRLMKSLDDAAGANVCVLSMYRTPDREQRLLFSKHPSTFGLPIELITRAELLPQLAEFRHGDRYSLAEIARKYPQAIGITASRSFGATLDELLQDKRVTRLAGETALGSLLGMVSRSRLDYALGYPDEMVYLSRNQHLSNLLSLPLAETASFSLGFVGCNATADNAAMLESLNQHWRDIYSNVNYLALLQRWLDTDAKLRVERVFQSYLRERQLGSPTSVP